MEDKILMHLGNPQEMEKLYRSDREQFQQAFRSLYPDPGELLLTQFWHARFHHTTFRPRMNRELWVVIFLGLIAGLLAFLPAILQIIDEQYYIRNTGFIAFAPLTAYFIWKNGLPAWKTTLIFLIFLVAALYINILPGNISSDAFLLICAHLPMVLWALTGLAFFGMKPQNITGQLGFLKYNGDLLVLCTLLIIAGGILSAVTIGLYGLTGYDIETFFFQNIAVVGLGMTPVLATYLTRVYPELVGKVSPVIAGLFMPLVLLLLLSFLVMVIGTGGNPFQDREFLTLFNVILIGVMAIIFFMVSSAGVARGGIQTWGLLLLAILTLLIDGIALSAIIFRITEWGFTPNRTAVLGANVLIFIHLILVIVQLYRVALQKSDVGDIGKTIVRYIPVYIIWAVIVVLSFPWWFDIT